MALDAKRSRFWQGRSRGMINTDPPAFLIQLRGDEPKSFRIEGE